MELAFLCVLQHFKQFLDCLQLAFNINETTVIAAPSYPTLAEKM